MLLLYERLCLILQLPKSALCESLWDGTLFITFGEKLWELNGWASHWRWRQWSVQVNYKLGSKRSCVSFTHPTQKKLRTQTCLINHLFSVFLHIYYAVLPQCVSFSAPNCSLSCFWRRKMTHKIRICSFFWLQKIRFDRFASSLNLSLYRS